MLVDNTYPPTREVSKAIKRKTLCADSIPASGSLKQNESLTGLFNYMWTQENLLELLKVASNNDLYKCKGNRNNCENHRGISFPLLGRLWPAFCSIVSMYTLNVAFESLCGFCAGRSATIREVSGAERWTIHHLRGPD